MARTRLPGAHGSEHYDFICPGLSPGPLGWNDWADYGAISFPSDTPGPAGVQDGAAAVDSGGTSVAETVSESLTPMQMEEQYHNITFPHRDPSTDSVVDVRVNIHIYANNGLTARRSEMSLKDRLVGLIRAELRRNRGTELQAVASEHRGMVAHTFFAKGTPAECRVTCIHALRYGLTTPGGLQTWVDRTARIGLDCSGYVNAYFKAAGRITAAMNISDYRRGTRRNAAADVRDLDVLVWEVADDAASDHIAVIDHMIGNSEPRRMVVVESSGSKGGLTNSTYTIRGVERGVFEVDRGNRGRSRVRIVAPPSTA